MPYRLLLAGTNRTYAELTALLEKGEVLVATWLRSTANVGNACLIDKAAVFDFIVSRVDSGSYLHPCFYASTTGSTRYLDYTTDAYDLPWRTDPVPTAIKPVPECTWGQSFALGLTPRWREIVPGLRMKRLAITPVYSFQTDNEWSPELRATDGLDWQEFASGVQMRKSPSQPGFTEFRLQIH